MSDYAIGFFLFLFLFWIFCLNHLDIGEIAIARNSRTGQMLLQDTPGWYLTSPFVRAAKISTLPMVVMIPSAANVMNIKNVRFNKEGWKEFVEVQGFHCHYSMKSILLGYAFSGLDWPFLQILQKVEVE